ncbi:luc7-like protein 3 [Xenia sp. Carnegie-2017]|uniref:luc7-like protein 3 n=1 Tax=Xenia sp. Carnegie-2017 TaxID=2897299 RepID=UPI001F034CD2|nr:luc7-like protein 3 [Xenia sp. Carnegie-2017]XP_046854643.1 luc7-like protein 3 [Xenia sp. Carnegie-2017]
MLSQAQLLDELMGRDRNLAPQDKKSSLHWSDPGVCKMFLAGFCPHDLFTNTRSDLGYCEKIHDDKLREEYKTSRRFGTMNYEEDFLRYLQSLLSDVDRRIRRGHSRLLTSQELMKEKQLGKLNNEGDREKEAQLTEKVNSLVEQAEKLGCEGKVEEAQGMMKLVEQLKEERDLLTSKVKDPSFNGQEKLMEVCDVCGAFLIIGDAQIRVDDHLQGKQHKGYAQIKAAVEEMKSRPWLKKSTNNETDRKSEDKERNSDKDRGRRRESDGDRNYHRDRYRDRSSRDRDRRDRDRDRRDRDRDRRDRDRDRRDRRRDRSRSRDRDRSRDRRRSRRDDRSRSRNRDEPRDRHDEPRDRHDDRAGKRDEKIEGNEIQGSEVSSSKDDKMAEKGSQGTRGVED